jgi:hypothetical protein
MSPSKINLSWQSSASAGVTGYKVYRGGALVGNTAATSSYSDTGLTAATSYTYAVAAFDAAGNASAQSTQAATTTLPAPPAPPSTYATCDQTVKNVPASYPTIQAAINAASVGDTIKVAAGTYAENVNLKSGICLEGAGVDQTVIAKSGAPGITGSGVTFLTIKNLTVKNSGNGNGDGGGIRIVGSNNVTLQSCRSTGNVGTNGGGIFISGSTVTIDHCLFDGNTVHNTGAGIEAEGNSTVTLTNTTVANNTWANALGNGGTGGIMSYGSSLQISTSILWGNNSDNITGGGFSISGSDISGWAGGTNNVNTDPKFVSASDYHLQSGSPATGMGAY